MTADVEGHRAAQAEVGEQQRTAVASKDAARRRPDFELDLGTRSAQLAHPVRIFDDERHESGERVGDGVAEGSGNGVAMAVAAGFWDASAACGKDDCDGLD